MRKLQEDRERVDQRQCEQIGLFFKGPNETIYYKSSPNIWQSFGCCGDDHF